MLAPAIVEGASTAGPQPLQLVAVLLGVLVFGVIVLLVERRNSNQEAAPPAHPATPSSSPDRRVYRAPASAVPIASARDAAESSGPPDPYPVPFLAPTASDEEPG